MWHFTDIPTPVVVRTEVTTDNTSIRLLWEWSDEGLLMCLDSVRVDYKPGSPTPTIEWLFNWKKVKDDYSTGVGKDGSLTLTYVELKDAGTYIFTL